MPTPRTICHLMATLLVLTLCLSAHGECQSISQEEELLRKRLLHLLDSPAAISREALRPLYRRPTQIPVRTQEGTETAAMIELGKKLFFDKRLSSTGTTSCATCHDPRKHWVDGRRQSSEGNSRRSMSLYNLAWDSCFTWHCDAGSLMSQGMLAMTAPRGMRADPIHVAQNVASAGDYKELLRRAFPKDEKTDSPGHILSAIEHYVSTLVSSPAPFDRWIEGDEAAISPAAKRGFLVFHKQAPCARCHNLWRFSDSRAYDIGIREPPSADPPLYKAVGLRNIGERSPYMHDGSIDTLNQVISFYERGGDVTRPTKSPLIKPFALSGEERKDLLEFLKSLSSRTPKQR